MPAQRAISSPLALGSEEMPVATEGSAVGAARLPGGGPVGKAPLIRALRSKNGDLRQVASAWLERFAQDGPAAVAELVSLILIVADVPSQTTVTKEDLQDRDPAEVVQDLTAALALEASEHGADFTQHWLVSREKGALRVRENYPAIWRELVSVPSSAALLAGLLQILRSWTLALSECQFRSVRHAAVVAALSLVEGLGHHCTSLREFSSAASLQLQSQASDHPTASLNDELERAKRASRDLEAARTSLGATLLSRRTKDVDPEIRRSCFEALAKWAQIDAEACLDSTWTRYLHFGLNDRDALARTAALVALQSLLRGDAASCPAAVKTLAEHVRPRVLARCHDSDPSVGAAAIRCASALASRNFLAEDEFDTVIDLVWDSDSSRRGEAAVFVSKFVFSEDVMDYPSSGLPAGCLLPTGLAAAAIARRRLLMLLQFLSEYSDGHLELVEQLVAGFWRRASCLEDWEAISELLLPNAEAALTSDHHAALVHLAEATIRFAAQDADSSSGSAHAEAVLDRAARALAPRLPLLLAACQAEPKAMRRAAALSSHLLRHCALRAGCGGGVDGLVSTSGEASAEALKGAFLRQPDPDTLEYLALSFSHLLDLCAAARPIVRELATSLHARFMQAAPCVSMSQVNASAEASPAEVLLSTTTRLRILSKAFDVSLCDLEGFVATALGLVEDRANPVMEGSATTREVSSQLVVVVLELLVLVLTRHAAAILQPEPLARCVAHDPVEPNQIKLAPTAAEDLLSLCTALVAQDPCREVRSAAFASSLALVTGWWNGAHFATAAGTMAAPGEAPSHWVPSVNEELSLALCGHLGELLTEANSVPTDTAHFLGAPEPGSSKTSSAFTHLFTALNEIGAITSSSNVSGQDGKAKEQMPITDSARVRFACLACALVASCRHHQLASGPLPALVLSQALSPREDLQEAAWLLLRRLRKEAHYAPENAEAFFSTLLRAVQVVHQDTGSQIAKDLSYRLLQHVGVGKLVPNLQASFVSALRAGIEASLVEGVRDGLLEALTPWITKHVIEDAYIQELATWAEAQAEGSDAEEAFKRAGLLTFLEACKNTTKATYGTAATEVNEDSSIVIPKATPASASKRRRTTRDTARGAVAVSDPRFRKTIG